MHTLHMSVTTMRLQALKLFYKGSKLSVLHMSGAHHTVVSANHQNLCETNSKTAQKRLLATDAQDSTVAINSKGQTTIAYSPFGKDSYSLGSSLLSRFTGQSLLASGIGYLLGNGHRLFNPGLMRYHSPDSLSPFDKGGINAYVYCANDPMNRVDPNGKSFRSVIKWKRGGYSYKNLAPRLKERNPALSKNEYNALNKSIAKREKKLAKELNWALSNDVPSTANNAVTAIDTLQEQRSRLDNLVLDEYNRYNPNITNELFGNIPIRRNTTGKLAEELLATPTPQSPVNLIPEDLLIEDMQERLRRLRNG